MITGWWVWRSKLCSCISRVYSVGEVPMSLRAAAILCLSPFLLAQNPPPKYPGLPSEAPQEMRVTNYGFDYARRDVMIAMRDGVKLHTVILVPKGAKGAPILLTRTPYDATGLTTHAQSAHLGPLLSG